MTKLNKLEGYQFQPHKQALGTNHTCHTYKNPALPGSSSFVRETSTQTFTPIACRHVVLPQCLWLLLPNPWELFWQHYSKLSAAGSGHSPHHHRLDRLKNGIEADIHQCFPRPNPRRGSVSSRPESCELVFLTSQGTHFRSMMELVWWISFARSETAQFTAW